METLDKLCEMGFKIENKGTYMMAFILDNYKETEMLNIMKVYQETAKEYNTTVQSVVRSIRYAIKENANEKNVTSKRFILNLKREISKEK